MNSLGHLPGILDKPFRNGLALVRAITRVGFLIAVKVAEHRVGERVIGVQRVIRIRAETDRAVEFAPLALVLPDAVNVAAELDRVPAFGPGDAVAQVEREVGAVLEEAVVEADVRRILNVEGIARDDIVRVGRRKPLPRRVSQRRPRHRGERVPLDRDLLSGSQGIVEWLPALVIAADTGLKFRDHCRREDVRPAGREPFFGKAIALREEARGRGGGGNRVALILGKKRLAAHEDPVLLFRHVVDSEQLGALREVQDFLDLIVVVVASDRRIYEIRQRQNVQQNLTVGVQAVGGNDTSREWRLVT